MRLRLNRGVRFSLLARARVRSPLHPTDIIGDDSASRVRLCGLYRVLAGTGVVRFTFNILLLATR